MKKDNKIMWVRQKNELVLLTDEFIMGISFVESDIVRFRMNRGNILKEEETFVVEKVPVPKEFKLVPKSETLILDSGSLILYINLNPLSLRVFRDSKKIVETYESNMIEFMDDTNIINFILKDNEKIYGLGQDPMGNLNQRGKERRMWQEWGGLQRSGNAGIPFYSSSKGYGLLLNSSWPSRFAVGEAIVGDPCPEPGRQLAPTPWPWDDTSEETDQNRLAILLDGEIMDIFIICRDSIDAIQKGYVDLTGHAPMPPKWALGYIQCKNRYRSQEELLTVARDYRRKGIPCDVLVIDWLWFKTFGDLDWSEESWPDPEGILKELSRMGFHVMQAQHPYVDKESLNYKNFTGKDYLNMIPAGTRPTFDHSNPEGRNAWWEEIKRLYIQGIRGYWTDMGELEDHPVGTMSHLGSRERIHNIYSLLWVKGLYEGQRRDFNERVFSLPRTAYAGIQRYGTALWSGDISSSWEVLKDQVIVGQGVCLSGQQYWTTDIGGFISMDQFDAELYIRWFQWGTFCPLFRSHGTRSSNEAWSFGKEAEEIITGFIKLRYELMPYIYSCARKVTENGTPIMRSMCVDFPDDPIAIDQHTQFMFGPAILVAPVLEKGARTRCLYLPEGIWYDFGTGEKFDGKQWIEVIATLKSIPLFIRAGSIIPMEQNMQHTGKKQNGIVELHAYTGKNGEFELYEDDGLTYNYEGGEYVKTLITMDCNGHVNIGESKGCLNLIPSGRNYQVIIHDAKNVNDSDDMFPVNIILDSNVARSGLCTVHTIIENKAFQKVSVKYQMQMPYGWGLVKSPLDYWGGSVNKGEISSKDKGFLHLTWELIPVSDALPVFCRGSIEFEITLAEEKRSMKLEFSTGSGYVTQWSIIKNFDNSDKTGYEKVFPVETFPELPYYNDGGQKLVWSRAKNNEFNCMGYVDLRLIPEIKWPEDCKGVAYAKCNVWSDEDIAAYIELSAEPSIKLWINNNPVFESNAIVFEKVIKDPVNLKKGWNFVLLKIASWIEFAGSGREFGFRFRFLDAYHQVIEKLLYKP